MSFCSAPATEGACEAGGVGRAGVVCAVVGERVHVAQAGAYAEVSGESVSDELSPMETLYSRA